MRNLGQFLSVICDSWGEDLTRILTVSAEKCTGCRACELACSMANTGEFNPSHSRIHIVNLEGDFGRYPVFCLQCYEPLCAEMCLTGAIVRDRKTGIVRVSKELCNGCRLCEDACPFGDIIFSEFEEKAVKCELCDGNPQCVPFCLAGALDFRESEEVADEKRRVLSEKLREVYQITEAL